MINNYAFNPNPRVHKPNLTKNGNSTGNVKIHTKINEQYNKFSNRLNSYNGIEKINDYKISSNNKIKRMIKTKKRTFN